jgi:hypothetical protein
VSLDLEGLDVAQVLSDLKANPSLIYLPGPTMARFIMSTGLRDCLRAANQTGKSVAAARRASNFSVAHPGSVLGVLVADLVNHYPELCAKVWEVIDRAALSPDCKYVEGKGFTVHGRKGVSFANGSRWLFRSGTGQQMGLEGFSADAGWIDEVPQRGHYHAFVRGVHGPIWLDFTPIGRAVGWLRHKIEGNPDSGAPPTEDWTQYVVELSLKECPFLTAAEMQRMIDKVDAHERGQRLRGDWDGPARSRVFDQFVTDCIVDEDPPRELLDAHGIGIDHGKQVGHQFGVLIAFNEDCVWAVDEWANSAEGSTSEDDARELVNALARRNLNLARVAHWVGDSNVQLKGGKKLNELLSHAIAGVFGMRRGGPAFVVPTKGKGSVAYRERVLNLGFATGRLKVHKRCVRLIKALYGHQGGATDPSKDACDALGYVAMDRLIDIDIPAMSLPEAETGVLGGGGVIESQDWERY